MNTHTRADDVLDAICWTEALIDGDTQAMAAIARGCDPGGMLDALGALYAGLIVSTVTNTADYFAHVRRRAADLARDCIGDTP